ncbi:MAG: DUF1848 domain-containing protein [Spirochaetaceae bacterium]|nr:DUF1848 domain-containing protein [Spirochaetaceae bacterium]
MIINTGLRTDIPAFFADWFINRIKAGYVCVRNPYNRNQVTEYLLNPDVVDLLVFCSKNPIPLVTLLKSSDVLHPFRQFWFVTITPYESEIEPNVPDKQLVIESFKELSCKLGINSVCWRYDPIFVNEKYTVDFHISAFRKMSEQLSGFTETCVISFIDLYKKVQKNFSSAIEVSTTEQEIICKEFVKIGKRYNISVKTCGESRSLAEFGADVSGCMTKEVFEKAAGCRLDIPKMRQNRKECACILTADIGEYNTCSHFCKYCYANYDRQSVIRNNKFHDKNSAFLIGTSEPQDIITQAKQISWRVLQKELW